MGIKKKMSMGVMSAALGLSLVGGGTWAVFSDTETVAESYQAGILDLVLKEKDGKTDLQSGIFTSELTNLKPGDSIEETIRVKNNGTLSIKDVVVKASYDGFTDGGTSLNGDADLGGENSADDFAKQIHVLITDKEGTELYNGNLKQFKKASDDITDGTSNGSLPVLPNPDSDPVTIKLTFKESADNRYMNDKMNVNFEFVASQFEGTEFTDGDNINELNASQTEK
ncbi:TasA family protein [Bacillus sp. FJAT-47783]|uniref:TasA family protein n=1 Tax=Bacillus sp. FJAT-47783 TaxID=2922712 RepID=UPI001FAC5476|nr:TasA family protein [Bacillus sp. FJAT-47783]